jgi:hypothetical protein
MGAKFYWLIFCGFAVLLTLQAIHYLEFQGRMTQFVSKGPRFTAHDGQLLCERVQALEKNPQPCAFAPK